MSKHFLVLFVLLVSALQNAEAKTMQNFFNDKTKIENPFNLRDPFKAPGSKSEGNKHGKGFYLSGKGQYSNISESNLNELTLNNIKVVGVLIGKERRALVNAGKENSKIIILKEGMKVGPEQAELKAILPGGIVLVEKITNVYGEEEYLETVIPISR